MERRDWLMLLALAAIWGSSYLFIKIGLREMSPSVVVFLRVVLGAAVLVPFAWRSGALSGLRPLWGMLVTVALIQVAGPFVLIAEGEREISSSLAGILVASVPIYGAILAIFFDQQDRVDGLRGFGVILGLVGVVLLFGVDLGDSGAELLGGAEVVLAGLGYAIGGLLVKRRLGSIPPLGIAAVVMVLSSLMVAPFAAVTAPAEVPGIGPLAAVAALGIAGTGVAFAIFYGLIARVGPARTFIVTYLAPGFAVIYGASLLDEAVTAATVGGLGLILLGSYLAAEGRLLGRGGRGIEDPVSEQLS